MAKTKKEKWFSSSVVSGWHKSLSAEKRRKLSLKAHKYNYLSTARALQALANVTTDKKTKKLARADALYFYDMYKKDTRQAKGK